ncbi:unnamed protein product [Amoebophrya sp. A25]|nr:unnamed protein product [Amoebophrya sp. A25]|eukprot:GSA25T00016957001.1
MASFKPEDELFGQTGAGMDGGEEDVTRQYIHIRNQQRNGKKSFTLITGVPSCFNHKKIVKYLKKSLNCNGNIVEDETFGTVIQLQGDQRNDVAQFLYEEGIAEKDQIRKHM